MRKCSETENQILRTCDGNILSYDGFNKPSGNILPILIPAILLPFALCILTCVSLRIQNSLLISLLGVIAPIACSTTIMILYTKNEMQRNHTKMLKPFHNGTFSINNGTFLAYVMDYDGRYYDRFTYIEEGCVDSNGQPLVKCCHLDGPTTLTPSTPIIILYTAQGIMIPLTIPTSMSNLNEKELIPAVANE